jgi:glucuronosyltransferase
MGSILQGKDWELNKREAFIKAFGKLKQKVLWKYENETLPNKPDNVMISSWIPQRDVLAHTNIQLFITHGGLLGATEALSEGVPVLGIPIFGDQKMNINIETAKGYALTLSFNDITEESVTKALDEILNNPEISSNAKKYSRIYKDRLVTPQETAVYWVEYAIRHEGATHLRAAGLDLSYFALHSIDVYVLILVVTAVLMISLSCLMKLLLKKLTKINSAKIEQKLKVNCKEHIH